MKKRIAVLLTLAIGFAYYPSGTVVMAAESQRKNVELGVSKEKAAETEENTVNADESKGKIQR